MVSCRFAAHIAISQRTCIIGSSLELILCSFLADVPQQPAVRAKGKSAKRNEAKRKKKEEEQLQQADGMLASQTADLR